MSCPACPVGARSRLRPWRGWVACAALAALSWPTAARADEVQAFEFGRTRFDGGQYEDAAGRFEVMLDANRPPCADGTSEGCRLTDVDLVERARGMFAASLVALGQLDRADAQIEAMLRANPAYAPNPAVFPQEVIDRFTVVRGKLRDVLDAMMREKAERARQRQLADQRAQRLASERVAELERLAREETIVDRSSRWVAMLPFGAGQFQNGDIGLGSALAGAQILAGATSIVSGVVAQDYASTDPAVPVANDQGELVPVDRADLNDQVRTTVLVNRVAFGVWAGLTVLGIVQAQVAFVPEKTTVRPRKLPQVTPIVTVGESGGVMLGVGGRF